MRTFFSKGLSILIFLSITISQTSCTKEKAEALKGAAEQFRVEADAALRMSSELRKQSVSLPIVSRDEETKKIVKDIKDQIAIGALTAGTLTPALAGVLSEGSENTAALSAFDDTFSSMAEDYNLFASMFHSLPRGNWFSKDAVARAKRISIKLTARFVIMADDLQKAPVQFTGRRTSVVDRFLDAQNIADATEKNQAFVLATQALLQLRDDEKKANDAAILQCLKAAEAGKLATDLIDNYAKLTVADVLSFVKEGLDTINSITGSSNPQIKGLVTRYTSFVNTKIKTDDIWKDVLLNELSWNR